MPASPRIPNWQPLILDPAFPEYVSGHSTFSAAAATVLTAFFGDNYAFSTTSTSLPGVTRSFTSFEQAAQEAGESRIYGGIHFEFSNQDGQTLGQKVGQQVLRVLRSVAGHAGAEDPARPDLGPRHQPCADHHRPRHRQSLRRRVAAGPHRRRSSGRCQRGCRRSVHAAGRPGPDGSADGTHTLVLVAIDAAGNATDPLSFTFTLDTKAPLITLAAGSVQDGGTLEAGARLSGAADPTGSRLASLTYRFGNDTPIPMSFDATTGAFDQALDLSKLDVGTHTLTVTARDVAGNRQPPLLNLTLADLAALTVTGLTPMDGASDVGVTYRPKVTFSRAVDLATLTSDSFYATDSTGRHRRHHRAGRRRHVGLAVLHRPAAWRLDHHAARAGQKISGAADGTFLDADGDGTPGSVLTESFTTVSTAVVPDTTLTGKVVDPGPDLQPMTFDDVRAGPDQTLHTADDVYLQPIAHVKVYILGHENEAVFTDAQGNFTLTNVPTGDVKVAVDGRTATNAPSGFYFPEMVMDTNIKPGVVNTLMGSMGTSDKQAANANDPAVYLPRLQALILTNISTTDPTTVTAPVSSSSGSGSTLTGTQLSQLTLTVQPGSLVDAHGNPVSNAKVGISPVPASLVMDMLPPGLMQHTFDITIQAPDAVAFTTPATLTMPNVFGLAPGEKTFILSFDHTTGRLVIDGTATVSADGLTVTTDPGQGVTMPGWHGLTPPGSEDDRQIGDGPSEPPPKEPPGNTTFEAGIEIEGNWIPLSVFAEFKFDVPLPGSLDEFQPIDFKTPPFTIPKDPLHFNPEFSFEFTLPNSVAEWLHPFDFTLFNLEGKAGLLRVCQANG